MASKTIEALQRKLAARQAALPSQQNRLAQQLAAVEKQIATRAQKSVPTKGMTPQKGIIMKPFKGGGRGKKG